MNRSIENFTVVKKLTRSTILLIFLQAKIPKHFQNYRDNNLENFQRPELPTDFNFLEESKKANKLELYR
ncbi:predicted protein [Plenodomus lingam JN3]|uniref:Predicted protein n=1 Tax=Leptosphaeria maculans (strain JN3 / isolate v23.1.3 / race Av1-4-5-6-7-8) TaxID=985895 RepID=E5A0S2_LEPMJ|nr:predicted protein [Plenodomus lingam JN3]CBX97218.1 predicted protein [Plenodomus lingam JN3]